MASVEESVSSDKRKGNGQRGLQEEAGKSKKKMYSCKYKQTWEKNYLFICKSHKGDEYAKCYSCSIDISVAGSSRRKK